MKSHGEYEKLMSDALFGSLSDAEQMRLESHLAECPHCANVYMDMKVTLEMTAVRSRPEPSPAFWDTFSNHLEKRLVEPDNRIGLFEQWTGQMKDIIDQLTFLRPVPRWAYQLAMAVVLVGVGIFIGKGLFSETSSDDQLIVDSGTSQPAFVQPAALETRTLRYMERSKVLLLGMVNFDVESEHPAVLNLPRSRTIARELVDEAEGLKEELDEADQLRLRELITDLEIILLQIANLEAENDIPAIELVQSGVDRRAILLKINVEEMRMERSTYSSGPRSDSPSI